MKDVKILGKIWESLIVNKSIMIYADKPDICSLAVHNLVSLILPI